MFFGWIALAVAAIGLLAWLGGKMARAHPDTAWERREDRPMIPGASGHGDDGDGAGDH